jgi:hypothetical protein
MHSNTSYKWLEPYYNYLGYTYVLEYDEDPDDRTRKNMHIVLDPNKNEVPWCKVPNWGSYTVPTFEEFQQFVIDLYIEKEEEEING